MISKTCGCEDCAIDRAMAQNDWEALNAFIAQGKILVLEPEQVAAFHEGLSEEECRSYEVVKAAEGNAAAFGFIIKGRLKDAYPDLRINFPGRRLQ